MATDRADRQSDGSSSDRSRRHGSRRRRRIRGHGHIGFERGRPDDRDDFRGNRRRRRRGRGGPGVREPREYQGSYEPVPEGDLETREGLLDILPEGYGFLRTDGYLPGDRDVYVSAGQVRKFGLRKADLVVGPVRPARAQEKFPALIRIDSVNGMTADEGMRRPTFRAPHPALPGSAVAARGRGEGQRSPHPDRRPDRTDRQGPARPDRVPAQSRQDHGAPGDRPVDHHQQPGVLPDGRAGGRTARRGHRHAAVGEGGGHLFHLRPSRRRVDPGVRTRNRAGQAPGGDGDRCRDPARLDHPSGASPQPRHSGLADESSPVVSTRPPSIPPSGSSVQPGTSKREGL